MGGGRREEGTIQEEGRRQISQEEEKLASVIATDCPVALMADPRSGVDWCM